MRRRRRSSTRRRATRQVAVFRANPIRRRRRRTTHRRRYARNPVRRYASNPIRRHRRRRHTSVRRYRRNPSSRGMLGGTFGKLIVPAAGIGAGAVGTEILMGYLPIPANLKTGVARHVTKGVVGVAAGMILGRFLKMRRLGNYFALGAVAIATHDAIKEMIASRMPAVHMGQYRGPIRSSFAGHRGIGYVNPAQTARLGYMPPIRGSFAGAATVHGTGGETDFRA